MKYSPVAADDDVRWRLGFKLALGRATPVSRWYNIRDPISCLALHRKTGGASVIRRKPVAGGSRPGPSAESNGWDAKHAQTTTVDNNSSPHCPRKMNLNGPRTLAIVLRCYRGLLLFCLGAYISVSVILVSLLIRASLRFRRLGSL